MGTLKIQLSHEILQLIGTIDEFKGEWKGLGNLPPEKLQSLRRIATIESVGSSTRIEGAQLTDSEVETFLGNLETDSFRSRDEEEVAGYAYVMNMVHESWTDMPLTEGLVKQLHRDLLRYSSKDQRHRGEWKSTPNNVAAFGPDGEVIGIVFETASPFDTPMRMEQLLGWYASELEDRDMHPLLSIGSFIVQFLAIHPFQDGNGRLSRILTMLLLLRGGYGYVPYSSLESIVEHRKAGYYRALRTTQTTLGGEAPDWEPWITFFLRTLRLQIQSLRERLDTARVQEITLRSMQMPGLAPFASHVPVAPTAELSPLAEQVLALLEERKTLQVSAAAEALQANRNTLKLKFAELVEARMATLHGKGRGAYYRPVKRRCSSPSQNMT